MALFYQQELIRAEDPTGYRKPVIDLSFAMAPVGDARSMDLFLRIEIPLC